MSEANDYGRILSRAINDEDFSKLAKNIRKKAQFGAPGVSRLPTFFVHPLYELTNVMLPRETREINLWARHYYRTDPLVGTAIDLHTEFPLDRFVNVIDDPKIKEEFDYLAFDVLDLPSRLLEIAHEYWKIGNVFPFAEWDDEEQTWRRVVTLNPDYIRIDKNILAEEPVIKLIPDDKLRTIVSTRQPREIYDQLPSEVVQKVQQGEAIPLDTFNVTHIEFQPSPYLEFGFPLLYRCFKVLIYKDRLREVQWMALDRYGTPTELFLLGESGRPASEVDVKNFERALFQASQERNRLIIWGHPLKYEVTGGEGRIRNLQSEYDWVDKELLAGLGISRALVMGEGPTFGAATVGFKGLMQRYARMRQKLSNWIEKKIYKPYAEARKYVKSKGGEIRPLYPRITWERLTLDDDIQQKRFISELAERGIISYRTTLSTVGLDLDTETSQVRDEKDRNIRKEVQEKEVLPLSPVVPSSSESVGIRPRSKDEKSNIRVSDFEKVIEELEKEGKIRPFQKKLLYEKLITSNGS